MKYTVKLQKVYCNIMKEEKIELVVTKGRTSYIGKLFFQKEEWEVLKGIVEKEVVETNNIQDVLDVAYKFLEKHNMLAKDGSTMSCMQHWQYMNDLSDQMIRYY